MLIYDKKNSHGKVKFALLEAIGNPKWDVEVPNALLKDAFAYYQGN
jgi:3-dehydroquinate synthase